MLGRGGMNDEINILNAISLLEHPKSQGWGWPASSQLHGDVGLHPSPPAIPWLPFHAPGEIAAPRGYRLLPPPHPRGVLSPLDARPTEELFPLHAPTCSPPSRQRRQDKAGDRHVPASAGSFIGTP